MDDENLISDTPIEDTPIDPAAETGGAMTPAPTDANPHRLGGMYRNWFLDYASYVILERAVPDIDDGLKPVQRRILHTMKTLDDGRFNKVANIVGSTMQYHPHGDASIYEALVQLGQKDLLVETQGNWGNVLTGASAAAGRYIEARLSEFALETMFSPKVTRWTPNYDGRKKEPVTLPAKFPLLLAQGVEGIAVGLSSKILPHNFNEIIDAQIAYLEGREFELVPDFVTGGMIDVSRYNDGRRGGSVKIRAKIEKIDTKTLAITEIPYGKTTGGVIESILKAFDSGKIKLRKVDDNTAAEARIVVHLLPGTSSDKTIDALYAFTDCEVSVSPNCCVIRNERPEFLGVSDVLRHATELTRSILEAELKLQRAEVAEQLFFASLERIFIEERIYKDAEYEQSLSRQEAMVHIRHCLEPWADRLLRPVTEDDLMRLFDIKMGRIIRYNADRADRQIAEYKDKIAEIDGHLGQITLFTVNWLRRLKEKYGEGYPRRTLIRSFDSINAAGVAEANERLYINREEGFIGTGLKKDEPLGITLSSLDDVIVFHRDGSYKVMRVAEKMFVGKDVIHVGVFKRGDERTIYNVIYRDGRTGPFYMKRFAVSGVTRDREYTLTQGTPNSRVVWFTANPNGEAETVKVILKPRPHLNRLQIDIDFGNLAIKGRTTRGNLVTRNDVHRVVMKERGVSTLGGLKVWFDPDVLRLNTEGRGTLLGEFSGNDRVLVVLDDGRYYTSTYDLTNHYEPNILRIEKFNPHRIFTAVLIDKEQGGYPYLKRFTFEETAKPQRWLGDNPDSQLLLLTDTPGARLSITFGAPDDYRPTMEVTVSEFVAVKSVRAKGKRLTTWVIDRIDELEPEPVDEPEENEEAETAPSEPLFEEKSDDELRDEMTGQQRIF